MSVVDVIGHYQRSIEKCSGDPQRLLHCMGKLYGLPISVHHLQTTGVGRTVNSLRKYEGAVGEAAKALVLKWKQMVTDEGSSEEDPAEDDEEAEKDSAVETGEEDIEEEGETVKIADSEEEEEDEEEVKQRSTEVKNVPNEKVVRREEGKNHHHHRHKSSHSERREVKSTNEKSDSRRTEGSSKSSNHESKREDKHWEKKEEKRREERKRRELEKEKEKRREEVRREEERREEERREEERKEEERKEEERKEEERKEEERKEEQRRVKEEAKKREERRARKEEERRKQKEEEERRKQKEEEKKRRREEEKKKLKEKHKEEKRKEAEGRKVEKRKEGRVNGEEKSKGESSSKEFLPSKDESEVIPSKLKKKRKVVEMEDGSIDCGSGASFAEALGMVEPMRSKGSPASPSKLKKKKKEHASPLAKSSVSSSSLSATSTSGGRSSLLTPKSASELLNEKDFDVLSPSAASRLEPLEVDIAATLPQTVPHYRPLPYPRLDYSPPRGNHNKGGVISEEEALSAIMTTKNQRTKVYSGSRSSFTYVPTLYELCIRLLQENIDALGQTGGVPFDLLKPVLERATPQQLLFLEDENPYLIEDTDALWCFHCQKDFRNRVRQEMETWREMYLRCSDEREAKLKTLTANIQRSMVQAQMPVRRTKLAYVDTVAKPPRSVARTQAKYGTSRAPIKPFVKPVIATPGGSSSTSSSSTSRLAAASLSAGGTSPVSLSSAAASARIGVVATSTNKKPKPAPLMQKTLKFMKGRFKR